MDEAVLGIAKVQPSWRWRTRPATAMA